MLYKGVICENVHWWHTHSRHITKRLWVLTIAAWWLIYVSVNRVTIGWENGLPLHQTITWTNADLLGSVAAVRGCKWFTCSLDRFAVVSQWSVFKMSSTKCLCLRLTMLNECLNTVTEIGLPISIKWQLLKIWWQSLPSSYLSPKPNNLQKFIETVWKATIIPNQIITQKFACLQYISSNVCQAVSSALHGKLWLSNHKSDWATSRNIRNYVYVFWTIKCLISGVNLLCVALRYNCYCHPFNLQTYESKSFSDNRHLQKYIQLPRGNQFDTCCTLCVWYSIIILPVPWWGRHFLKYMQYRNVLYKIPELWHKWWFLILWETREVLHSHMMT